MLLLGGFALRVGCGDFINNLLGGVGKMMIGLGGDAVGHRASFGRRRLAVVGLVDGGQRAATLGLGRNDGRLRLGVEHAIEHAAHFVGNGLSKRCDGPVDADHPSPEARKGVGEPARWRHALANVLLEAASKSLVLARLDLVAVADLQPVFDRQPVVAQIGRRVGMLGIAADDVEIVVCALMDQG